MDRIEVTLVSKEDYLQFSGIDLDLELTSRVNNDVGDNPASRFIWGIEEWCKDYLQTNYDFNREFKTDYQIECFKIGVMYQIAYVLKNGTISNDSGYNMATGVIIPRLQLDKIKMAPDALQKFRLGGLANFRRFSI